MDSQANPATKRPTPAEIYEEVARQRRREEAIARRNAQQPEAPDQY
jgi:hypothetical protein